MEGVSYFEALREHAEGLPHLEEFLNKLDPKRRAILEKRKIKPCCPGDLDLSEKVVPLALSFSALQEAGLGSDSVLSDILLAAINRNNTAAKHRAAYAILLAHSEKKLQELEESLKHINPSKSSADLHSRIAIIRAQELTLGRTGTLQYPSIGILEEARAIHPEDAEALRRGEIVKKHSQVIPVVSFSCCGYEVKVVDTLNSILSAYERVFSCRSPTYVPPTFPLPVTREALIGATAGFLREHTSHVFYNPEVGLLVVYRRGRPVARLTLLHHDNVVHVTSPPLGLPVSKLKKVVETLEEKVKTVGLGVKVPWLPSGSDITKRVRKKSQLPEKYKEFVNDVFDDDYKVVRFE